MTIIPVGKKEWMILSMLFGLPTDIVFHMLGGNYKAVLPADFKREYNV